MMSINKNIQSEIILSTMEELVPKESLFRKVDKYVDFTFIYEKMKDLYCEDNGRPSIDPVVLFKIVFIQTLDGIKSMRKTCDKIKVDAEYRWFLGIPFGIDTPHFTTFGKNYERRFKGTGIFEEIFAEILKQAMKYRLVGGKETFTDSTHQKANANKRKFEEVVEELVVVRKLELEKEINEERIRIGRKEFEYKDKIETKTIKKSKTDPESGYYHRDNKEGFMYLDHRTVDGKCNIILDSHITKGNVHDSKPYIDRMEYIKSKYKIEPECVALDSGYSSTEIMEYFEDNNILGVIGYRRFPNGKKGFIYHEDGDFYECPTGLVLPYSNIDRNGYKEYYSSSQCNNCPIKHKCCKKEAYKKVRRHIKEYLRDNNTKRRLTEEGKELYKKRKVTVERSFADSKQNHGFRYSTYRGLEKVQDYTWLFSATQNMKNIAIKRDKYDKKYQNTACITDLSLIFWKIMKTFKNLYKRKPLEFSN